MPLRVSILRSSSGSKDCSLLKLHIKNYEYTIMFICDVTASVIIINNACISKYSD
jgi:hypothetical protein